jgi:undecaprenyl-diphosphatase
MFDLSWWDAIAIGLGQSLALVPGVSRSGITISVGLFAGLDRAAAARFSFLLATPVIIGAGLVKVPALFIAGLPADELQAVVAGIASAAIVGFLSIHMILRYVQTEATGYS